MAQPLTVSSSLPQNLIDIILQSRTKWLEPPDVAQLLHAGSLARELSLVCTEPALQPAGGSLYLFDKAACRNFRQDGHNWEKKSDGNVKENHMKLKVEGVDRINCYYSYCRQQGGQAAAQLPLTRRSYWLLGGEDDGLVLVHYLRSAKKGSKRHQQLLLQQQQQQGQQPQQQHGSVLGKKAAQADKTPVSHRHRRKPSLDEASVASARKKARSEAAAPAACPAVNRTPLHQVAQPRQVRRRQQQAQYAERLSPTQSSPDPAAAAAAAASPAGGREAQLAQPLTQQVAAEASLAGRAQQASPAVQPVQPQLQQEQQVPMLEEDHPLLLEVELPWSSMAAAPPAAGGGVHGSQPCHQRRRSGGACAAAASWREECGEAHWKLELAFLSWSLPEPPAAATELPEQQQQQPRLTAPHGGAYLGKVVDEVRPAGLPAGADLLHSMGSHGGGWMDDWMAASALDGSGPARSMDGLLVDFGSLALDLVARPPLKPQQAQQQQPASMRSVWQRAAKRAAAACNLRDYFQQQQQQPQLQPQGHPGQQGVGGS
ncbi:hypothetical protein N2152v2_006674 [Parachlorella kessleri]